MSDERRELYAVVITPGDELFPTKLEGVMSRALSLACEGGELCFVLASSDEEAKAHASMEEGHCLSILT